MNTKFSLALTIACLSVAAFPAAAQNPPQNQHKWDISKVDVSKLPPASDQKDVTFEKDILPLFKASCVRCHGEQRPRQGMQLDTLEGVLKGGRDGKMVVPGDSKQSLLVVAAAQIDPGTAMPPKRRQRPGAGGPPPGGGDAAPGAGAPPAAQPPGADGGAGGPPPGGSPPPEGPGGRPGRGGPPAKPLTAEQVGLLRAWIDQGAK